MSCSEAEAVRAWAVLDGAVERHPLLVIRAARFLVDRHKSGRYGTRVLVRLLDPLRYAEAQWSHGRFLHDPALTDNRDRAAAQYIRNEAAARRETWVNAL